MAGLRRVMSGAHGAGFLDFGRKGEPALFQFCGGVVGRLQAPPAVGNFIGWQGLCQALFEPGAFFRQFGQPAVNLFQLVFEGAQPLRLLLASLGVELALFTGVANGWRCFREFFRLF